ncbi:DUF192 domain-containing protein [Sphingomonas sp. RS6]
MVVGRGLVAAFAATVVLACGGGFGNGATAASAAAGPAQHKTAIKPRVALTIHSASGDHRFEVEVASTPAEQQRGLMFRTNLDPDGGMLFVPYPADGGPPREASFWMKNTPSALDILFIRADGTIARIAADAPPFSTDPIKSGEPVAAVLEIPAGRAAALGIVANDVVRWKGRRRPR